MVSGNKKPPKKEACSILRSWTPTTTQQLQGSDTSSTCFDVLDHVLDDPSSLSSELAPWLSQLKPARTLGDVQAAEILSLLPGISAAPATTSRGDANIFISRQARSAPQFTQQHATLAHLINSVQDTAEHYLSRCITFDRSLTSVQLAVYPGDGTSGYPKHCDRSKALTDSGMQRIITCVYYVTPSDWTAHVDGGSLRVFSSSGHYDVVPYSNRMVVFRSDVVDHQVMPSLRRGRMALTIWLYGKLRDDYIVPNRTMVLANDNNSQETTHENGTAESTILPPPLLVSDESHDATSSIFVSIAAYRDSELGPTLRSLFESAQHPKRVVVGVVLQLDETVDQAILDNLPTTEWWMTSNVNIMRIRARHARGPCYARELCQKLYDDEDYVLQTDSHMRFRSNWDTYLIEQLRKCQFPNKSMLTTYPVGYKLPNEIPDETRATLLVPWKFDQGDGMLRQRARLLKPRETRVPCHLYAAGFNFAHSSVVRDVPYDGRLQYLFFGEELSMAVRLYTHGYDLFAPPETVCYHLWSRSHRPTPLQEDVSPQIKHKREAQRNEAREVVLQQLRGQGRGLGTERTASEFAKMIGVNFEEQSIDVNASLGGLEASEFAADISTLTPDSAEEKVALLDVKTQAKILSFLDAITT